MIGIEASGVGRALQRRVAEGEGGAFPVPARSPPASAPQPHPAPPARLEPWLLSAKRRTQKPNKQRLKFLIWIQNSGQGLPPSSSSRHASPLSNHTSTWDAPGLQRQGRLREGFFLWKCPERKGERAQTAGVWSHHRKQLPQPGDFMKYLVIF